MREARILALLTTLLILRTALFRVLEHCYPRSSPATLWLEVLKDPFHVILYF